MMRRRSEARIDFTFAVLASSRMVRLDTRAILAASGIDSA